MTKKHQTSSSPFYDKEFANQTIRRKGHPALHSNPDPHRYSTNISCLNCQAPARIETHPTKTIYRCIACQALLATITHNAEVNIA